MSGGTAHRQATGRGPAGTLSACPPGIGLPVSAVLDSPTGEEMAMVILQHQLGQVATGGGRPERAP